MTEQELELFRPKIRPEPLLILARGIRTGLAGISPSVSQGLRDKFAEIPEKQSAMTLKGVDPAYSQMFADEYREALEDYLSSIESGFKSQNSFLTTSFQTDPVPRCPKYDRRTRRNSVS